MNIKYRQLKAFALAGKLGSFRQAAAMMSITQPSFSVLIRELEQDLGMRLFERNTRNCSMTPAGVSLYLAIDPVLYNLEEVYQYARDISSGRRGRLTLATVPSLACGFVADALGRFSSLFPDVQVQLMEDLNGPILKAVKQNNVEIAIAILLSRDPEVVFTPLFTDRLILVAPKTHPISKRTAQWKNLGQYPMILLGSGSAERALAVNDIKVAPAVEVSNVATAIAMVRRDLGITLVPSSGLANMDLRDLRCLPMPGAAAERDLGVVHRCGRSLSAAALSFLEVLRQTPRPSMPNNPNMTKSR